MKRVALCVGINDYGVEHSLRGAVPDARLVGDTLKDKYETVELLTDAQATVSTIRERVRVLAEGLSWGDVLVFFFSGHGCDTDGVQTLVVPVRDDDGNCIDDELLALDDVEKATNVPGVQRVFVLDCCRVYHTELIKAIKRFVREVLGAGVSPAEAPSCPKPLLLASCARGQSSVDDVHAKQGHFTRAFVRALKSKDVRSFDKFRQKIDDYMGDYLLPIPQTPFIEGGVGADVQLLPSWRKRKPGKCASMTLSGVQGRGPRPCQPIVTSPTEYANAPHIVRVMTVRDMTHASLGLCAEAVKASGGSLELAIKHVKDECKSALGTVLTKRTRSGTLALAKDPDGECLVGACLRCETDMGAHTEELVDGCEKLARDAMEGEAADDRHCAGLSRLIGEKISQPEIERLDRAKNGCLSHYLHMRKILSMVELRCGKVSTAKKKAVADAAHAIAVHVAAMAPQYLAPDEIPQKEIGAYIEGVLKLFKREKKRLPPKTALDAIKRGIAAKYAAQVCLLWQPCLFDESITVEDYLCKIGKKVKDTVTLGQFKRMSVAD